MSSGSAAASTPESAGPSKKTDNRVAFLDQASFVRLRASGLETIAQTTWNYYRRVDVDGLQRLNRNLAHTLVGRRLERSPLPFGRPRWVACHEVPEIHVATTSRPRSEVVQWMDERAQVPVDPEHGPVWHFSVQHFDDGGSAVTMVASHTVADALGLAVAFLEALNDVKRDFGYPPPGSRSLREAVLEDLWDAIRGLPAVIAAFFAALAIIFKRDKEPTGQPKAPARKPTPPPAATSDEPFLLPTVSVNIDLPVWDARAAELGASSNVFFIAFGTKLAQRMGRVNPVDGTVSIAMPVSERTWDDTRGNALTAANFRLDPDKATTDLRLIHDEVKRGLAKAKDEPNELLKPLPLVPYMPKWLARKLETMALGGTDLPVGCSNLRDMTQAYANIDGVSDGDYGSARMFNRGITREGVERQGGELYLVSGRINGQIFISVCAYHPGAENNREWLRGLIDETIGDFGMVAASYE